MNFIKSIFCYITTLLIVAYLPLTIIAQSTPRADQSFVDTIIEKMALKHQISEAPDEIRLQFEQNPLQLSASQNQQLLQQFDDAYSTDLLLNDFKTAFEQELRDPYRSKISQWLSSSNAQSVTDARQFYYTLQGKRQRVINRYEMDQNPPDQQRKDIIQTLTDTTSVADSSVESMVIIVRSMIKAINQISEQRNFTDTQINTITGNFRMQMQAQAGNQLNSQLMVMYHGVPSEALNDYIAFWGTEAGRRLDRAISQSMQSAYNQATERLLQSVKQ